MPDLSEQDCQKILTFLQSLYGSRSFEDFATYVREAITELVPAEPSVFVTIDFEKRQTYGRGPTPHIPDLDELRKKHAHEHPFINHQLSTFDFSAIKISDFWIKEQLHRSEFVYHRFMRYMDAEDNFTLCLPYLKPQGIVEPSSSQAPNLVVDSIDLFRVERSFTERDRPPKPPSTPPDAGSPNRPSLFPSAPDSAETRRLPQCFWQRCFKPGKTSPVHYAKGRNLAQALLQ